MHCYNFSYRCHFCPLQLCSEVSFYYLFKDVLYLVTLITHSWLSRFSACACLTTARRMRGGYCCWSLVCATVFDSRVFSLMHILCNQHVKPLLTNAKTPVQVTQAADELFYVMFSYFISHFYCFLLENLTSYQRCAYLCYSTTVLYAVFISTGWLRDFQMFFEHSLTWKGKHGVLLPLTLNYILVCFSCNFKGLFSIYIILSCDL